MHEYHTKYNTRSRGYHIHTRLPACLYEHDIKNCAVYSLNWAVCHIPTSSSKKEKVLNNNNKVR